MLNDIWHFPRPLLAEDYLATFARGLTSARGLFARRRMGKTEFLEKDLMPAAPAPAPASTRPGWVAPVAAGAAGLAAGYALSQAMTPSVNNQQGYGQSGNGYQGNSGQGGYPNNGSGGNNGQYGDPVAGNGNGSGYAPSAMAGGAAMNGGSGSGFGFGSFLLLLILAGVGYAVYRKMQNKPAAAGYVDSGLSASTGRNFESAAAPAQVKGPIVSQQLCADLLPNVQRLFIELQELNNKGDLLELARRTMPDVYEAMKADITGRTEPSQTNVLHVDGKLVECDEENGDIIASIRYSASISERADGRYPEDVNEVWHYVKTLSTNGWILAGIEQL